MSLLIWTTYRVLFADGDIQWLDYADVMDTEALELYAGSKECTKLLLAGTAKEAQDRKRSLQGITITEAAEAGIIPALTVKQKVWISTPQPHKIAKAAIQQRSCNSRHMQAWSAANNSIAPSVGTRQLEDPDHTSV